MINIYSKPAPISLVDKLYVPPVEMLGKALESKQKYYDQNMAETMAFDSIGSKINAIGYHRQLADGILNNYQADLYKAVADAKGDYSMITPQLLATKQKLMRDMGPNGTLGKISAYAKMYEEWDKTYKNDKLDQDLYSHFKNKILQDTKLDANTYLSRRDFDLDMSRFQAIPENYQTAFKSVVDLASKYQITEGKYYEKPVYNEETGQWIVKETDTKSRQGQDYYTTISNLIALDPTIMANAKLRNTVKAGAGESLIKGLTDQAYNILKVGQAVTSQKDFFQPEHIAKSKAGEEFEVNKFYAGTAEGPNVESSALGTAQAFSSLFGSKPLNTKMQVNDEIKAALEKAVGPGVWNSKQGIELIDKLGTMAAKADKMTTGQYKDYLKRQFYNEETNFNYFSQFTDKNIIANQFNSKEAAMVKAQILSGGPNQTVTDLQGNRKPLKDLDDTWFSDTNLYEAIEKGNAMPIYVPKLGGAGKDQFGLGIRHNGNIYFLGNKTQAEIADYNKILEAKKRGWTYVNDPTRGNIFAIYDHGTGSFETIEDVSKASNLAAQAEAQGNSNLAKAIRDSAIFNNKK